MRRRHPSVVIIHWSRNAYQEVGDPDAWIRQQEDEDEEEEAPATRSIPLFPLLRTVGPRRWEIDKVLNRSHNDAVAPVEFDRVDINGPLSDDVIPIIFGSLGGVYVRSDVAALLRPHMSATQCFRPVHWDGDVVPYYALIETSPTVRLPDDWPRTCCEEGSADEFDDGATDYSPVYPDRFDPAYGVHLVGYHGGLFLDLVLWNSLRKEIPALDHWLTADRIVVDDAL